jgi:methylthioribose-1-phosphate isomerase
MEPLRWDNNCLYFVDQTALPEQLTEICCNTVAQLCAAIYELKVRGAPAIGIAGAFGVSLAVSEIQNSKIAASEVHSSLKKLCAQIISTRPTAVNLQWAVNRVLEKLISVDIADLKNVALAEANAIMHEDQLACEKMSQLGADIIEDGGTYITHCNAGPLATSGLGTALGVYIEAQRQGKNFEVLVDETRPLLQGGRLTTWELEREKISCRLIADSMAAFAMSRFPVKAVFVGADRIARNGDTANKIGSFGLAIAAEYHRVPFYIVAPDSTIDRTCVSGNDIPIEERSAREMRGYKNNIWAPANVDVWNPAFDIVPNKLISAIISDTGIHRAPFDFGGHKS